MTAGGRPRGRLSRCFACGELGHEGDITTRSCSASHLAVKLMRETGCTGIEAAARYGITRQAVSDYISARGRATLGLPPAKGGPKPRPPRAGWAGRSADGDVPAAQLADRPDQ